MKFLAEEEEPFSLLIAARGAGGKGVKCGIRVGKLVVVGF
jgi:hypothetical protein